MDMKAIREIFFSCVPLPFNRGRNNKGRLLKVNIIIMQKVNAHQTRIINRHF